MPDAAAVALAIGVVRHFVNMMMHVRVVPQLHKGGPTRCGQNRYEHDQVNKAQIVNQMNWNNIRCQANQINRQDPCPPACA